MARPLHCRSASTAPNLSHSLRRSPRLSAYWGLPPVFSLLASFYALRAGRQCTLGQWSIVDTMLYKGVGQVRRWTGARARGVVVRHGLEPKR